MNEYNAYILGTDKKELHRLENQHKIWKSEARKGWEIAEFKPGQILLDIGCGPGLCTIELANVVGDSGKVIGVDLKKAISAALKSFKESDSEIDVGRHLSQWFEEPGYENN